MGRLARIFKNFIVLIDDNLGVLIISNIYWSICCIPFIFVQFYFLPDEKLNFLWAVLSFFTFLFIPTATSGLFYLIHTIITEHDAELGDFLIGVKKYFLKSILLCLIYIGIILFLTFNIIFYFKFLQLFSGMSKYFVLVVVGVVIWTLFFVILSMIYIFPIMINYEITILNILKKAFLLELNNLLLSLIIFMAVLFLCVVYIISGFGAVCLLGSSIAILSTITLRELAVNKNKKLIGDS